MKKVTIISKDHGYVIELAHDDSDSGSWIVRRWKKFLWFKRRVSSDWFIDEQQAIAFAHELKTRV